MTQIVSQHTERIGRSAPRWRNLYFTHHYGVVWGWDTYRIEADARAYVIEFFSEWRDYMAGGGDEPCECWDGRLIPFPEFRFAIPLPCHF